MKETILQLTDAQMALKLAVERSIAIGGSSLNLESIEKTAGSFYQMLIRKYETN